MSSKLYRSRNSIISGVCGGIAEHFNLDPTIIRVVWILVAIPELFLAIIGYVVCAIIIPQRPIEGYGYNPNTDNMSEGNENPQDYTTNSQNGNNKSNATIIGLALILVGAVIIFKQFFFWFDFKNLWPALLIGIGIYIIIKKK